MSTYNGAQRSLPTVCTEGRTYIHTYRQIYRQIDIQTDRQTYEEMEASFTAYAPFATTTIPSIHIQHHKEASIYIKERVVGNDNGFYDLLLTRL
jgi:hypothetical protein